ncbi:MAG: hypothetical protein ACK52I_11050 [Pseudomonadota bacterium]|jgi:hypothetical protein
MASPVTPSQAAKKGTLDPGIPATSAAWVQFLRQYGPIPQSGNQFDEDIQKLASRSKVTPLTLPAPAIPNIIEALRAVDARSVIVAGTAGDGKTYHCREVWLGLGGDPDLWARRDKIVHHSVNGRELHVIRDLSELTEHDRDDIIPRLASDLLDATAERLYLVAANDGTLLELFRKAPQTDAVRAVHTAIEEHLVDGRTHRTDVRLVFENLSRRFAGDLLPTVIDKVTQHDGWSACTSCAYRLPNDTAGLSGCPIWENRTRLAGEADGKLLRARLGDLMELSEQDDIHLPVRELLLLTSNAILGHPDAEHGVMSCKDVPRIVRARSHDRASVYRNVFGENLTPRRREKIAIFTALNRFGVGAETNNTIDGILVYGADDPELASRFASLVAADEVYGGSPAFLSAQRAYLEGSDVAARNKFLSQLRTQRQRLFFTVPDSEAAAMRIWELTVFRHGGDYLHLVHRVRRGERPSRSEVHSLVRGLNRIFTGLLVDDQDALILASSGNYSQAKTSRLLVRKTPVARQNGAEVALRGLHGVPHLVVSLGQVDGLEPVPLALTLLRFEFLSRVADGALPSSFSLECYEDLMAFKAQVMRAEDFRSARESDDDDGAFVMNLLSVGADGRVHATPVEVRL